MKVLLEVVLILTVIAAGMTYGYYDFRVERGYRGSYLTHLGEIPGKLRGNVRVGLCPKHRAMLQGTKSGQAPTRSDSTDKQNEEHHETEKAPVEGGYAKRTFQPEREVQESPKHKLQQFQAELDKADQVLKAASTYYRLAVMNEEKRQEYARKILDITEETLRKLNELNDKYPDQPELEERLQEFFRLRQFAVKELGARQPDGKDQ